MSRITVAYSIPERTFSIENAKSSYVQYSKVTVPEVGGV
jgi:hypothetical protein